MCSSVLSITSLNISDYMGQIRQANLLGRGQGSPIAVWLIAVLLGKMLIHPTIMPDMTVVRLVSAQCRNVKEDEIWAKSFET